LVPFTQALPVIFPSSDVTVKSNDIELIVAALAKIADTSSPDLAVASCPAAGDAAGDASGFAVVGASGDAAGDGSDDASGDAAVDASCDASDDASCDSSCSTDGSSVIVASFEVPHPDKSNPATSKTAKQNNIFLFILLPLSNRCYNSCIIFAT